MRFLREFYWRVSDRFARALAPAAAPVEGHDRTAGTIDPEAALETAGTTDAAQIESAVRAAIEEGPA